MDIEAIALFILSCAVLCTPIMVVWLMWLIYVGVTGFILSKKQEKEIFL